MESAELRAPDVIEELAARGVYHDDFARAELYTWTTAEQVTALRRDRRLLVAEGGAGMGPSPYLRGLTAVAERGGAGRELAALLLEHPALRRRRYAWTSPFATMMGLGPVRYGDALIRVVLAPRALLLRFRPGDAEPFVAVDLRGAAVPIAELLADPGRLGAVYHVRDGPRDELPFREYVLCNEAMVLAWSVATPEIQAQVDADIDLLTRLAAGRWRRCRSRRCARRRRPRGSARAPGRCRSITGRRASRSTTCATARAQGTSRRSWRRCGDMTGAVSR